MNPTQKGLSGVLVALSFAVPVLAYYWPKHEPTGWFLTSAIVAAFLIAAGKYCTNLWRGVLIDQLSPLNLSRFQFQMVLGPPITLSRGLAGVLPTSLDRNQHHQQDAPNSKT